jgi:hypothetical protein
MIVVAGIAMPDRVKVHVGAHSPLRGYIFLRKTLLRPARLFLSRMGPSRKAAAVPAGTCSGFLGQILLISNYVEKL